MACVLATSVAVAGPDPYATARKGLERQALSVAEAGRKSEARALLKILKALGTPPKAFQRIERKCEAALVEAQPDGAPLPKVAKAIRRAAALIGKKLSGLEPVERKRVAELLLELDGQQDAAHAALGHKRTEGQWLTPAQATAAKRADEIAKVVIAAKALPVPVEKVASALPFAMALGDGEANTVRWGKLSLHTARVPKVTLENVVAGLARGLALSRWFETGKLELVQPKGGFQAVFCASHQEYRQAIKASVAAEGLSRRNASIARQTSRYADERGFHVVDAAELNFHCAGLLVEVWHQDAYRRFGEFPQPSLAIGHLNWIALELFERAVPGFVFRQGGSRDTSAAERKVRQDLLVKAGRSVAGTREYLAHLASRGEDPPFTRFVTKRIGRIDGDGLLKCTLIAAFLQERGDFAKVLRDTVKAPRKAASFEGPLGGSIADLESAWKTWLLAKSSDLVSSLER